MSECIFCRIVAGEIGARIVHADDDAVAFLDLEPFKRGHTLVVPRRHVENILQQPEVLAGMAPAIAATGNLLMERLGATGLNVLSNVNEVAGQSVFHLHVHLVPRYDDDPGIGSMLRRSPADDLDEVFAQVQGGLRPA